MFPNELKSAPAPAPPHSTANRPVSALAAPTAARPRRNRKILFIAAALLAAVGLALAFKFRNTYRDPRENAAPAPRWNADAEANTSEARPVKLPEADIDEGELHIDIQMPTSQRDPTGTRTGAADSDIAGVARLTGGIETEIVAERPAQSGRPWVR